MELPTHPDGTIDWSFKPTVDQASRRFFLWNTDRPLKNMYDIPDRYVNTPCADFQQRLIVQTNLQRINPVSTIRLPYVIKKPVPIATYRDPRF